jgi:TATA-box binding protein (TBP) (component of TFIID and TFIIIB)
VNIVARYIHHRPIKLFQLAQANRLEFEQELFPAVRLRFEDLKITVNIFRTGKCMILGAKGVLNLRRAVVRLQHVLEDAES